MTGERQGSDGGLLSESAAPFLFPAISDRGALLRLRRLRGVELPVAQFDAASSLVPRNDGSDLLRPPPPGCSRDFLLRLAVCQGKDLLAEGRRGALATSWFRGRSAPALPRSSSRLRCGGRGPGWNR